MKFINIRQLQKAYTEGIYADTYQNRKLGRVGMSYKDYENKVKDEEESKKEQKDYYINTNGGSFKLIDKKCSKDKIIELGVEFCEDYLKYNDDDNISIDIEEDTEDWTKEDLENKKYDWMTIRAHKYKNKVEIQIRDWNKEGGSSIIRDDTKERIKKETDKKLKEASKKAEKEFEENFGWMKELLEYKKNKEE